MASEAPVHHTVTDPLQEVDVALSAQYKLEGNNANYEVTRSLAEGSWADAYVATVTAVKAPATELTVGQEVVVKLPLLDANRYSSEENRRRLEYVQRTFAAEYRALGRLRDLPSVAPPLDYGTVYLDPLDFSPREPNASAETLPERLPLNALFIVSKLIVGQTLDKFFADNCGTDGTFLGMTDQETFFRWATALTEAVRDFHERMVIHGDLWLRNVMVDQATGADERIVVIDFGQAFLRDVTGFDPGRQSQANLYLAPEGGGQVSSDVYSLGCIFYFMATAQHPPKALPAESAPLKLRIQSILDRVNRDLYAANPGIADVIARCLRPHVADRVQTAEDVLQDLYAFSPPSDEPLSQEERTLTIPVVGRLAS